MPYLELILAAPWVVRAASAVLAFFVLLFAALFLLPGLIAWYRYDNLVLRIRAFKKAQRGNPAALFAGDKRLAHIWAEYEKTLHRQREFDPASGQFTLVALRATVPAGTIFTQEALVDSRIRTEFFKHLPGLCTGIGIIGTFAGLIDGLRAFHIADDPTVVRTSLEFLLRGVFQAFLVSAGAITLAMAITFVEKFLVTTLYRKVEEITFELDSSFQAGVGEEYLERLVNASEGSADRIEALKATLVQDLKAALTEISAREISAQAAAHEELARQLSESLRTELIGPIWRIATSLEGTPREAGEVSQAISTQGAEALAALPDMLERLLDKQTRVIGDALGTVTGQMQAIASDIGGAVRDLTAALREQGAQANAAHLGAESRMSSLTGEMQRRIEAQGAQSQDSVARITDAAAAIQAAAADFTRAAGSVTTVLQGSTALTERLSDAARAVSSSSTALQAVVRDHAGTRDSIAAMLEQLRASVEHARRETSLSGDALQRIDAAAQALGRASVDVEAFLDRIGDVLERSHGAFASGVQKTVDGIYNDFYRKLSEATQLLTEGVAELAGALDRPQR
jgi:hypothetical protein